MLIYTPRVDVEEVLDGLMEDVVVHGDMVPACSPEDMSEVLDEFLSEVQLDAELFLLTDEEMKELLRELEDIARMLRDGMRGM
ncbi:hypothetical protein [Equine parapoxvirus]|nr:hypothetical protein [Equine parapoxvirus]